MRAQDEIETIAKQMNCGRLAGAFYHSDPEAKEILMALAQMVVALRSRVAALEESFIVTGSGGFVTKPGSAPEIVTEDPSDD